MVGFLIFLVIVLIILFIVVFSDIAELKRKMAELEITLSKLINDQNINYNILRNVDQRLGIIETETGHKNKSVRVSKQIKEITNQQMPGEPEVRLKPKQRPMQPRYSPAFNTAPNNTARVNAPVYNSTVNNTARVTAPTTPSTAVDTAKVTAPTTPSTTVNTNTAAPNIKPAKKNTDNVKTVENWLGTKLFNILASLLIFTGLVLFCMLGYEYITNGMKIAAMFVISTAFIGIGSYFTRKNRSVFSLGLTGCGSGSFFISILVTHIYFHAINDIIAFSMLLLWIVLTLFMSKKLDSLMLSVTAHLGMAVSVCLAFSFGFSADNIVLPIIYEFASIAVVIVGNMICYKKTYRFGLFLSMAMMNYSSFIMCYSFYNQGIDTESFSVLAVFIIKALAISFISYLISISTAALDKELEKESNAPLYIHILNKFMWCVGIIETFGFSASLFTFNFNNLLSACIALTGAIIAHLAVTLFISEKLNFNETLSRLSIGILSVCMTVLLIMQCNLRYTLNGYPYIFIYAALLLLIVRFTRLKRLNSLITVLLVCEMVYMIFFGYRIADNMLFSVIYMAEVGAVLFLHWFGQDGKTKEKLSMPFKIAEYIWLYASVIPINTAHSTVNTGYLIAAEFAILGIIASFVPYSKEKEQPLRITIKAMNIISLLMTYWVLATDHSPEINIAVKIILIVSSLALTVIQVYKLLTTKNAVLEFLAAVLSAAFVTVVCINLAPVFAPAYIVTTILSCEPFLLFAAIAAVIIYSKNKDDNLAKLACIPLVIDIICMMLIGYRSLCNWQRYTEFDFKFNLGYLGIVHLFVTFGMMMYILMSQKKTAENREFIISLKAFGYYQLIISAITLCSLLVGHVAPTMVIAPLVCIINIAAILTNFGKFRNADTNELMTTKLEAAINITSCVSLCGAAALMYQTISDQKYVILAYALRFILIILSLALYYLLARIILKEESRSAHFILGITFTLLSNIILHGLMHMNDAGYVYTALTMVIALMNIIFGFKLRSKGLRIYGLVLSMLCVLKLVIFDIGSENSLARVGAFVVGGIVCFIISGIYNAVEKKLLTVSDSTDIQQ
ncbi:MAG: DUF2339 domain-containing protein [Clostridia bacterium]|nr:DUF2339 domain-containing protein [Clostridia bacterium]